MNLYVRTVMGLYDPCEFPVPIGVPQKSFHQRFDPGVDGRMSSFTTIARLKMKNVRFSLVILYRDFIHQLPNKIVVRVAGDS